MYVEVELDDYQMIKELEERGYVVYPKEEQSGFTNEQLHYLREIMINDNSIEGRRIYNRILELLVGD